MSRIQHSGTLKGTKLENINKKGGAVKGSAFFMVLGLVRQVFDVQQKIIGQEPGDS